MKNSKQNGGLISRSIRFLHYIVLLSLLILSVYCFVEANYSVFALLVLFVTGSYIGFRRLINKYYQELERIQTIDREKISDLDIRLGRVNDNIRSLMESSSDCIMIVTENKIVFVNQKLLKLTGFEKEELEGQFFLSLIASHADITFINGDKDLNCDTLENKSFEFSGYDKSGNKISLEISTASISYDNRNSLIYFIRDISDRNRYMQDLKDRENFLVNIFEAIQDRIFIVDLDMTIIKANKSVEDDYTTFGTDVIGKKCYEVFQHERDVCIWCPGPKAMKTGKPCSEIIPFPCSVSKDQYLELTAHPMYDDEGRIKGIINYVKDITQLITTQTELHKKENNLQSLINSNMDFIWSVDSNYTIQIVNSQIRNFYSFAYGLKLQTGMSVYTLPNEDHKNLWRKYYPDVMNGASFNVEETFRLFDTTYILTLTINPIRNDNLDIIGITCYAKDITDARKAEEELKQYRINLEKLVEERTNVLSLTIDKLNNEIEIRKRADDALRKSEELYRNLVERAGIAILICDTAGNFVFFNNRFNQIFGYTNTEMSHCSLETLIHPEDHERILSVFNITGYSLVTQNQFEFKAVKKDKSVIYVEAISNIVKDEDRVVGNRTYLWDITQRKIVENEWQMTKEKLSRRLRYEEALSTSSAILLSNKESALNESLSYLMHASQVSCAMIMENIPDEKGIGQFKIASTAFDCMYFDNSLTGRVFPYPDENSRWIDTLSAGGLIYGNYEEFNDEEKVIFTELNLASLLAIPIFVHGNWYGFLCFGDIYTRNEWENECMLLQTSADLISAHFERKFAENLMKKAMEEAEELSLLKSQFLANVSHEIRTPMNGIIGFSEIILSTSSLDTIHSKAKAIIKESESLILLINDILDHTKIEAGKTVLEYTANDLYRILEDIADTLTVQASSKEVQFNLIINENVPRYVLCDGLRLRQVLMNLATNAVKFTQVGYVTVSAELLDEDDSTAEILFSVIDTGIGIPEEKQKVIFDSYVQADGSTSRKFGGTGLGTTISKQLVELMDGKIGLKSAIGEGSTFWFSLSLKKSHPSEEILQDISFAEEIHEVLAIERKNIAYRILLVEDYPPNQEVVKIHLESIGYFIDIANNGYEGVDLAARNKYSLILMDLQMPGMDGFETTGIIRGTKNPNTNVPIIALTANADAGTRYNCINQGMNDLITKPIRRNNFLKTIDKWIFISDEEYSESQGHNDSRDIPSEPSDSANQPSTEVLEKPFNLDVALEEFGDMDVVEDVAVNFIANVEKQLPAIKKAIDKAGEIDFEFIRKEAHSIKGASATLEAVPLSVVAKELEMLAKEKKSNGMIEAYFKLESEFIIFKEFIDKLFIKM